MPAEPRRGARRLPFLALAIGALLLVPAIAAAAPKVLDDPDLAAAGGPTVTLTGAGVPGELVVMDGRGFKAHQVYQLHWDSSPRALRLVWPNTAGRFHGHLRIPAAARDGAHRATFSPVSASSAASVKAGTTTLAALSQTELVLRITVDVQSGGQRARSGPVISSVKATNLTQTGARISWSLNMPATGQVEFGATTTYGQLTTPELSFTYSAHVQQLGGLAPGTLYHYRVKSKDSAGHMSISSDFTFSTTGGTATPTPTPAPTATPTPTPAPTATPTPTPAPTATPTPTPAPTATPTPTPAPTATPTPTPAPTATPTPAPTGTPTPTPAPTATPSPGATGIYGTAINADTKDNIRVGPSPNTTVGIRFKASVTSSITAVRFSQRWGSGYSLGNGGTMKVSIQADNAGLASGTDLGSMSFAPGNPGTATSYDNKTIGPAVATVAGSYYWVIFRNTDANPSANYISINGIYTYTALAQRQPRFANTDLGVYVTTSVQAKDTPTFDVTYANGSHDGQGFIGMVGINGQAVYASAISGTKQVREHFTPTTDRTVTQASVRVRRTTGNDPLTITLKQGSSVLAAGSVPAASVPQTVSGGDNGGSGVGHGVLARGRPDGRGDLRPRPHDPLVEQLHGGSDPRGHRRRVCAQPLVPRRHRPGDRRRLHLDARLRLVPDAACSSTSAENVGRRATGQHVRAHPRDLAGPADRSAPGVVLSAPQECTTGRSGLPLRPTRPGPSPHVPDGADWPSSACRRIGTVGPRSDVPRNSTPVARRGRKATELPESAGLPNGDTIE